MRESPAMRAFALQVLDEEGGPSLDIDLTTCEYLDSTFLGGLVGLFRRFEQSTISGRFAIAGPATQLKLVQRLPPQRQAEVEDFVDFLRSRENDQRLATAAARASEPAFAKVWDNEDDAAYDRL